ncbi:glycosyltransferase family 9 protein [Photobacterium angustum]|uniref:Lipopolysaccharide heptosyltransferase family protein n=1 Tax=Photobacterium angustum TaxID=661 RepID=A0A855SCV3_PHOAN|nr:glycosyltransferase family 9 protein [Photobacterium angustum]KJG40172.1 hypothetical protein UA35_12920 [Photobacterium angustum]KJG48515.1 hypothetical protein UA30_13460 [Photobacterium angustum]KJG52395.1 hypothetical protein UA34_14330 [Photobacterium angustum]PSX06345.1 lipopolysaccharide heptosyltransferase family protein [Photobacterium angustum]PSX13815.1 lipopolysaccharide heptosyltransferase family protein [Photobacterium angustum]
MASLHKKLFRGFLNNRKNELKSIDEVPSSPMVIINATFQIGDYLSISPIIEAVKNKWHTAKIVVLCTTKNQDVVYNDERVECFVLPPKEQWYKYPKILSKFQEKVDLLIEPAALDRAHRCIIGYTLKPKLTICLHQEAKCVLPTITEIARDNISQAQVSANMMLSYGFEKVDGTFKVYENKITKIKTEQYLDSNNISDFIVLNPFASSSERSLNIEKSIGILTKVKERNINSVLLLPSYISNLKEWQDELKNVCHVITVSSINESLTIIKNSNGVISVDTSIVHIASSYNKPTIGIYTHAGIKVINWMPQSDKKHIVTIDSPIDEIVNFDVIAN